MMASLMALNALAIDIMLPALGLISDHFALPEVNDRQWTITSYIYGMAIGSILYGSLADRFGRRPVLLVTIGIYTGFGILCALAWDYDLLLLARFIQGLSASAMGVLANSIIRDRYDGDAMARAMSTIMMIFMIVPITAPLLGQLVLHVAPWKAIFLVLSTAGLACFLWVITRLPETLHPDNKTPIEFKSVTAAWYGVIFNRNSFGHVIASGLMMAPLFAYIASAQQIFFDVFGAGDIFVYIFALNAGAMSVASFTNSRIVMRFGARRVSQTALIFFILVSMVHFASPKPDGSTSGPSPPCWSPPWAWSASPAPISARSRCSRSAGQPASHPLSRISLGPAFPPPWGPPSDCSSTARSCRSPPAFWSAASRRWC